MNWFLLALLSAVTLACFTLIQRRFAFGAKGVEDINSAQAFQFAAGFIFLIIVILTGRSLLPDIPLFNVSVLTFGYGLGSLCIFSALRRTSASVFAVLYSSRVIWTAILSAIVLHDSFTPLKVAAVVCIILAVVCVSYGDDFRQLFSLKSGVLYALLAGLLVGIATVNDAFILHGDIDVLTYLAPAFLLPGIFLAVIGGKTTLQLRGLLKRWDFRKNLLLTSAFYSASSLLFYLAVKQGDITPISIVNQSQVVFIALGGIFLLKERQYVAQKIAGTLLATAGLVMIAIG